MVIQALATMMKYVNTFPENRIEDSGITGDETTTTLNNTRVGMVEEKETEDEEVEEFYSPTTFGREGLFSSCCCCPSRLRSTEVTKLRWKTNHWMKKITGYFFLQIFLELIRYNNTFSCTVMYLKRLPTGTNMRPRGRGTME